MTETVFGEKGAVLAQTPPDIMEEAEVTFARPLLTHVVYPYIQHILCKMSFAPNFAPLLQSICSFRGSLKASYKPVNHLHYMLHKTSGLYRLFTWFFFFTFLNTKI